MRFGGSDEQPVQAAGNAICGGICLCIGSGSGSGHPQPQQTRRCDA